MVLDVTRTALATMFEAARRAAPAEACGLLLGQGRIDIAQPTANVAPDPARHFEIDPQALIDAHRATREGGAVLAGYFHSHPSGRASPSRTDRAGACGDGRVWAIVAGEDCAFFRDCADGFEALSYRLVEG